MTLTPLLTAVAREVLLTTALHFLNRSLNKEQTMKLYRTTRYVNDSTEKRTRGVWHTSSADASKARTAMKKEFLGADPKTEEVEVKTTRSDLVAFLNELCKDD